MLIFLATTPLIWPSHHSMLLAASSYCLNLPIPHPSHIPTSSSALMLSSPHHLLGLSSSLHLLALYRPPHLLLAHPSFLTSSYLQVIPISMLPTRIIPISRALATFLPPHLLLVQGSLKPELKAQSLLLSKLEHGKEA